MSIEIDLDDAAQQRWLQGTAAKTGASIAMPYVFILTAEGKKVYAKNSPHGDLKELLTGALNSIGPALTPAEKAALVATIDSAEKSFQEENYGQAVSLLMNAKGATGFSEPAIKARELFKNLGTAIEDKIKSADEVFESGQGAFELAYDLLQVAQALPRNAPVRKEIEKTIGVNQRKESAADAIAAARELVRGDVVARSKRGDGGEKIYKSVVTKFPDSPAAAVAAEKLEKLGVSHEPEQVDLSAIREWTDITGEHKINAKLVKTKEGWALLEKPGGEQMSIPIEKLSAKDQALLKKPE